MKNKYITIKGSKIQGRGVYAKCDIPAGTHIIQYVGEKITKKEADRRSASNKHVYIFELNKRYDIDGDVTWNPARYINHSCTPNCETENINKEIWIIAKKKIKKGQELSYDYEFQREGWQDSPCLCGAKNCFGFIVARRYWSAIRKTKRYQLLRKA